MRGFFIRTFAIFLTVAWIFSGWPQLPFHTLSFPPEPSIVHGAVGSVYIARAPSTNLITNNSLATEQTLTYDTEVQTSSDVTRQSGNQAFSIQNSGRYLIIANTRWNVADIGNNNRHVIRTLIKVGGSELGSIYGEASGYGRDSGSADETGSLTIAYVDHTVSGGSGDDITFHVQNFGDTSVALADQFADESGIQIIRLPDDDAFLRVNRTGDISITGTLGFGTGDPTWNEFGWENQDDETDTSVIEWVSGNNITLKEAGHYLVIYGTAHTCSGSRGGAINRIKIDDTEVNASRVVSYCRVTDGAAESWVHWAGIIETSSTNQILNIDWGSSCEATCNTLTMDEAAMTVVRLPDSASYVRVYHDANRAGETTGVYPLDAESEDDEGIHSTASNTDRLNGTADNYDWLFFASWFLRNATADSTRTTEHFRWSRTGSLQAFGSGLSYTRGDQSTYGVPSGGRNAAIVATSLGSSEWIALDMRLESGTGNQNRDFIANHVGITGVALDTLATSNSLPVASGVSIDSGAASITLTENTTKNVECVGTVTDADGFADITSVTADFYRTSVGTGGGTDDNNYYQDLGDSECVPSGGSGNSETYTCTFPVQYFADPTDSGSPNAADDWTCDMTPTDSVGQGTSASDTIEMDSLLALDVTSSISYGSVDADTDTDDTNQTTTVTNTGNRDMDPQLSGTNMTDGGPNTIVVGQQKYSASTFTYSSGGTALSSTPSTLDITLPQRTSGVITDDVFWGIGVPGGTVPGTYTGTNTFTATAGI